jgi:hypothetical protein
MSPSLIQEYQPGGDIYNTLAAQYGAQNANNIAQAALSGDESQVNAAIAQAQFGTPLTTSTTSIFASEIVTDPLAAPLDDLNTLIKNSVASFFGNTTVAITTFLILGGVVVYFVGIERLKRLLK